MACPTWLGIFVSIIWIACLPCSGTLCLEVRGMTQYESSVPDPLKSTFGSPVDSLPGRQTYADPTVSAGYRWYVQGGTFEQSSLQEVRPLENSVLGLAHKEGLLRLRGGMGRKIHIADKLYKKRKALIDQEEGGDGGDDDEEMEEIAEEYRGLPLEERLKIAFDGRQVGDDEEEERGKGEESAEDGIGGDGKLESDHESEDGRPSVRVQTKFNQVAVGGDGDNNDPDAIVLPDGKLEGKVQQYCGERRLRTAPCTGDAWPGLFVDLEAKEEDIEIVAVCVASANYRIEPHVNVKVWISEGSSVGKEGDPSLWKCVFFAPNCTLPKVKRHEVVPDGETPYAQLPFEEPLRVPAGGGGCLALYTNSLCGLALRVTSTNVLTEEAPAEDGDRDLYGRLIGNATVPIVANAQQERRADKRPVKIGEITDSDQYLRIRAAYCSPITGWDHPFCEELMEREDEHVHAFVGEIVYNVIPASKS